MLKINLRKLYLFILVGLSVFSSYQVFPIPNMYVFFAIGSFFVFSKNCDDISHERITCVNNSLILFAFLTIIVSGIQCVSYLEIDIFIKRTIYFWVYFVNLFVVAYKICEFKNMINIYVKICAILSILIIVQYLAYIVGHPFSLIIPNLKLADNDVASSNVYILEQVSSGRFSTFFLEPAHQIQYVLPCLGIVLFRDFDDNNKKNNIFMAIIITVGLMCTTSMQGILGSVIIWILYIYKLFDSREKRKFARLFVIIPLFLMGFLIFVRQPVIQEQLQKKITSLHYLNTKFNTSMYLRMFVGWDCFRDMGLVDKLFGCGIFNAGAFLKYTGIGYKYYDNSVQIGYMSGMSKILVEHGIVGTILLFVGVRRLTGSSKDNYIFIILIAWLLLLFTSDCFYSLNTVVALTLVFTRRRKLNEEGKL